VADLGTGLAVLGTALGSKDIAVKILGPTADYIGVGLRNWTERRVQNVGRVFQNAKEKLGTRIDQPGAVPPRVLKHVLDEASYCEDDLMVEYFGGVLASSRTEVGRDDRGAAFAALVGRLTTYQVRSHYVFHDLVKDLFAGTDVNLGTVDGCRQLQVFMPFHSYYTAMDFSDGEDPESISAHVLFGLTRERLIDDAFLVGSAEDLRKLYRAADEPGVVFAPSTLGVELFLWAHGRGDVPLKAFLDPATGLTAEVVFKVTPGIRTTRMAGRELAPPPVADAPAPDPERDG
jgi:hypothetical protein